ncbi:hypothetical protein [Microbacterium sp. No. 7]|uniref:hypothetical protein n=1 Tax=Microbacterium sp. No. 7 TaxID=1714373 RepID=UPI0006D038AD|nr:hypothetical protein [Microbacterium sp. No. 7]ALJ20273.1 hypothetical protein AOA12_10250 [Microbacterium sp. No. 7]
MVALLERTSVPAAPPNATLIAVGERRWRVLDRRGRVLGHLERHAQSDDIRFRAQRFHAPTRSFRTIGEFWSADEAVECLRLSR